MKPPVNRGLSAWLPGRLTTLVMNRLILIIFLLMASFAGHAAIHFLTISDIHYGALNTDGDGQDTGQSLLKLAMKKYAQLSRQADFIITLGDLPTHLLGYAPVKADYEKAVFHALYEANKGKKPLFYVPGNNDALQGNYQPFNAAHKTPLDLAADWEGACAYCEGLLLDDSAMARDGYYASYVKPGNHDIILIVLNTTLFSHTPFFLPSYPRQQEAANRQLQWLKRQLSTYKARQLLIAMHIPPGNNFKGEPLWHDAYQQVFIRLLDAAQPRYEQISLLTSHTHMDEIRQIKLSQSTVYAYSTPSISRDHHNYSGMKLFKLNDKILLADFTTYYTRASNAWRNDRYAALDGPDTIFPQCASPTLASCLNALSTLEVCNRLEQGHYYGVKSDKVASKVCAHFYQVNPRKG